MLHFVTSYMKQNKSRKQTLEIAQYGLEISFNFCHYYQIPISFFYIFIHNRFFLARYLHKFQSITNIEMCIFWKFISENLTPPLIFLVPILC